jgi:hypothetical protein
MPASPLSASISSRWTAMLRRGVSRLKEDFLDFGLRNVSPVAPRIPGDCASREAGCGSMVDTFGRSCDKPVIIAFYIIQENFDKRGKKSTDNLPA